MSEKSRFLIFVTFFDVCSLQIVFASWHIYVCSRMCFGGKANWVICKRLWRKIGPTIPIWTLTHISTNTLIFQKEFFWLNLTTEICPNNAKRCKIRNFDNFCNFLNACLKPLFMVKNLSVWSAILTGDRYHVSSDPEMLQLTPYWHPTFTDQYRDVMLLTFTSKVWGCFFMPYEA